MSDEHDPRGGAVAWLVVVLIVGAVLLAVMW